jgi:heme exporter protein D
MAALVHGDPIPVDPDCGAVVNRPEMQHHAIFVWLAVELALLPAGELKSAVIDATIRRLRQQRHIDLVRPFDQARRHVETLFIVEYEFLLFVERGPAEAYPSRSRAGFGHVLLFNQSNKASGCSPCTPKDNISN